MERHQRKLHESFIKYGVENHKFEVIEECEVEDLLRLERHYGIMYNSTSEDNLNCALPSYKDLPAIKAIIQNSAAILKSINAKNPKVLGDYGFVVDDTKRVKKP